MILSGLLAVTAATTTLWSPGIARGYPDSLLAISGPQGLASLVVVNSSMRGRPGHLVVHSRAHADSTSYSIPGLVSGQAIPDVNGDGYSDVNVRCQGGDGRFYSRVLDGHEFEVLEDLPGERIPFATLDLVSDTLVHFETSWNAGSLELTIGSGLERIDRLSWPVVLHDLRVCEVITEGGRRESAFLLLEPSGEGVCRPVFLRWIRGDSIVKKADLELPSSVRFFNAAFAGRAGGTGFLVIATQRPVGKLKSTGLDRQRGTLSSISIDSGVLNWTWTTEGTPVEDGIVGGDKFGEAMAAWCDLDGDGFVDVAVSAEEADNLTGLIVIVSGATGRTIGYLRPSESSAVRSFGYSLSPIFDMDGDELVELAVASYRDVGGEWKRVVEIFSSSDMGIQEEWTATD